ncbi:23S rRNA (uracil(1939)-C(5))-methyltransferase RlmD [Aquisalimonas sp.]|uniref:23S rRNA (uracil(1939)-C(5))-methyltransferase RlmD n=1 Tax=Aquisalimonas sp. TaxID=1872621 RepID=UPI0025C6F998|nr:23S rRNA (uracil(1939)-C(5))-methyltransferase RlmD [Aquisalimonas sp.]
MGKRRRRSRVPMEPVDVTVESLSHEGRGIAHVEGKTVFVHGALPGETVRMRYTRSHRRFDEGRVEAVLEASPERIEPRCPNFGVCGGCSLQHMPPEQQIRFKQDVLLEQFRHIGGVEPDQILPPLTGPIWGYRRKARLAVKDVPAKGRVLVGFREKHSPYVADMTECHVLDPRVAARLTDLSDLIARLSCRDRLPQIEVAIGETTIALVFRNLRAFTEADYAELTAFGQAHDFAVYEQPGNETTVAPIWPASPRLAYHPAPDEAEIVFQPTDFTQVNHEINTSMVQRALDYLQPQSQDRILDLFCGLGNFSLPLAARAGEVVGVEGDRQLVERAQENAARNGVDNVRFHVADLAADNETPEWLDRPFNKILLDPPRSGAAEVIARVGNLGADTILYISCNPATLARDAGTLVHDHGYRLGCAGVMDMFPHTAHVESLALFRRPN